MRNTKLLNIRGTVPQSCIDIEYGSHTTEKIIVKNCILSHSRWGIISYDGHDHVIQGNYFIGNSYNLTNNFANGVLFDRNVSVDGNVLLDTNGVEGGFYPPRITVTNCMFCGGTVMFRRNVKVYNSRFIISSFQASDQSEFTDCQISTDDAYVGDRVMLNSIIRFLTLAIITFMNYIC